MVLEPHLARFICATLTKVGNRPIAYRRYQSLSLEKALE